MKKVSVAVIVDDASISNWQLESIFESSDLIDVKLILNCKNTPARMVRLGNIFYYAFAYCYARCSERDKVSLPETWQSHVDFNSNIDGLWQSIPNEVLEIIKNQGIELILKFGMGLLKVPTELKDIPILSYHHGDPTFYRGRPAVFYEMFNKENSVGIIVQRLTNILDAGTVLAFAEVQVTPYSYQKTIKNVYTTSKYLLKQAILSCINDNTIPITATKKIYKFPSNTTVVKLILKLGLSFFRKIFLMSFYDRYWQIAISNQAIDFFSENKLYIGNSRILEESNDYLFLADPFFCMQGKYLRCEGMSKRTGLGELVQIPMYSNEEIELVMRGPHLSYPISYIENNIEYLIPEMSALLKQEKFKIENGAIVNSQILYEFNGMAIKDPTILIQNSHSYCFFSEGKTANFVLHLWVDEEKQGKFKPHPLSPICISPSNARMGGNIISSENGLFRFGQCCNSTYGEAITIMKIDTLSPTHYSESIVGSIITDEGLGPHTISFDMSSGQIAFDVFTFKYNPFAWLTKFKALIRYYGIFNKKIKFNNVNKHNHVK